MTTSPECSSSFDTDCLEKFMAHFSSPIFNSDTLPDTATGLGGFEDDDLLEDLCKIAGSLSTTGLLSSSDGTLQPTHIVAVSPDAEPSAVAAADAPSTSETATGATVPVLASGVVTLNTTHVPVPGATSVEPVLAPCAPQQAATSPNVFLPASPGGQQVFEPAVLPQPQDLNAQLQLLATSNLNQQSNTMNGETIPMACTNADVVSNTSAMTNLYLMHMALLVNPTMAFSLLGYNYALASSQDVLPAAPVSSISFRQSSAGDQPTTKQRSTIKPKTTNASLRKSVTPTREASPVLRALSAYNFFFVVTRKSLLEGKQEESDWSKTRQERLLQEHWNRDRSIKRRHRKSHGKISFNKLSKTISKLWKELPETRKDFYREVAAKDWERYHRELTEYELKKANTSIDGGSGARDFQSVVG